MNRALPAAAIVSFLVLSLSAPTAQAGLVININAGANLAANGAALAAFNRAAAQWEVLFDDDIEVNINADLASLGNGILGSASSVVLATDFNTMRNMMVSDADADDGILSALPTLNQFNATLPTGFGLTGNLSANKAAMKAMGFTGLDTQFGSNDATITFSTNFNFDYDNSDGIQNNAFDFESVAAHEIGHALGFTSVVDSIDVQIQNGQSSNISPRVLDLFRFDAANTPTTEAEFTSFDRDLRPGGTKTFDDLQDQYLFSTGRFNGDGRQASHWKDGLGIGLMDPTLAPNEISPITAADIRALDLIGYDYVAAAVPEPGSFALTIFAVTGALVVRRFRRKKKKEENAEEESNDEEFSETLAL